MFSLADIFDFMWQAELKGPETESKSPEELAEELDEYLEEQKSTEGY